MADQSEVDAWQQNFFGVLYRFFGFDENPEEGVGICVRHSAERIDIFIVSARAEVDRHPAFTFRVVLSQFDKAPYLGASLHVRNNETLTAGIQQACDMLIGE